jgi:predicted metal-dependent peptidase
MPGMEGVEQEAAIITTSIRIENHQKSRGNVPGGLVQQARTNLQPPLVPRQRVLSSAVRRGARLRKGDTDTTWTRRNRRRHGQSIVRADGSRSKVVYPATVTHTPKIAVVRDTSGSMSKADLDRVGSEIVGISKSLGVKNNDLLVLDVDASVAAPVPFRSAKVLDTVRGGGGTDMRAGIEAAYALKERPHVCVVLSDGDSPWDMPKTVGMNVVVCVVGTAPTALPQFRIPSWMKTVAVPIHG